MQFDLRLTRSEIIVLRDRYLANEKEMLRERAALSAGERIANGDLRAENLTSIILWKSPRSRGLLEDNDNDDVTDALRLAVTATTVRAAVAVLLGLRGVQTPVASAILTTVFLTRFTIIDYRALETLGVKKLSPTVDDYIEYLAYCKRKASEHCVCLRDLDRAMWQKSKDGAG